jgi:hypothetical protein
MPNRGHAGSASVAACSTAPHPRAGCCGVSGPSPSAALDGQIEPSKRRGDSPTSPPGWGSDPPTTRGDSNPPIRTHQGQTCSKRRDRHPNEWGSCQVNNRSQPRKGDRSSGALWHTLRETSGPRCGGGHSEERRGRPRCGWGHSISLRFSSEMSERAGRRPALAFRSSSPWCAVPTPEALLSSPRD